MKSTSIISMREFNFHSKNGWRFLLSHPYRLRLNASRIQSLFISGLRILVEMELFYIIVSLYKSVEK